MITRIEIAGYKSIKVLDIDLKPINILLGGNGVGKSNFISLFSLIRNIYIQNFQNYVQKKGGVDSLLYFGRKNTSKIDITIYFKNQAGHENRFAVILEVGQEKLFIKSIGTAYKSGQNWYPREFEQNVIESILLILSAGKLFMSTIG